MLLIRRNFFFTVLTVLWGLEKFLVNEVWLQISLQLIVFLFLHKARYSYYRWILWVAVGGKEVFPYHLGGRSNLWTSGNLEWKLRTIVTVTNFFFPSGTSGIWRMLLPALRLPYLEYNVRFQTLFCKKLFFLTKLLGANNSGRVLGVRGVFHPYAKPVSLSVSKKTLYLPYLLLCICPLLPWIGFQSM